MAEGSFQILFEVVPELRDESHEDLKKLWREWVNEQDHEVRGWLTKTLTEGRRRVLQARFARDYYGRVADEAYADLVEDE
jgi:hypothetical protein